MFPILLIQGLMINKEKGFGKHKKKRGKIYTSLLGFGRIDES